MLAGILFPPTLVISKLREVFLQLFPLITSIPPTLCYHASFTVSGHWASYIPQRYLLQGEQTKMLLTVEGFKLKAEDTKSYSNRLHAWLTQRHQASVCCEDGEEFMGRKGSGLWAMGEIIWQSEGLFHLSSDYIIAMSALAVTHTGGACCFFFFPYLMACCHRQQEGERFSDIIFDVHFCKDSFWLNLSR